MTEIPSEADIHCPAGKIFDVIIDFRGPDRWLTKSSAFRGASEISSNPVTLGTTYCEPGPFGAPRLPKGNTVSCNFTHQRASLSFAGDALSLWSTAWPEYPLVTPP